MKNISVRGISDAVCGIMFYETNSASKTPLLFLVIKNIYFCLRI
jgi:hypothetical protein